MHNAIAELNTRLDEARKAYYAGTPIMSDGEYDQLEAQLGGMIKQNPAAAMEATVLTTVGTDTGGRIPHDVPMRSIQNFYTIEDVIAWYEKLEPGAPVTVASKWDGVSDSLVYEGGQLVKAVTRGDGEAGESVLPQVRATHSIPKTISFKDKIEIRGELIIRQSVMDAMNAQIVAEGGKPYVSTRNLVAGTMKLSDPVEVASRQVEFHPWEVICESLEQRDPEQVLTADSAVARLRELQEFGFPAPDDALAVNSTALRTELERAIAELAASDQEIGRDGIVIKVNSVKHRKQLGFGSKFANFQICFKPQNSKAESVLKEVIWQVGRQGRLTPVGIIEPVVLAGATIERVTLNNLSWIRDMKLRIGSRILVVRSGEVIPQIVEVLDGN